MSTELTHQQKMLTLTAVLLAMFLGALDQTIVSAAAPKIVADLQGSNRFTWIITAYLMTSTAFVPVYGKLADLYSRKSVEIASVSIFLFGSCLCGLAGQFRLPAILGNGMAQLAAARAIQGIGGAGLFSMAFVVIANLFPPAERGRYQGYTGAVFAVASILGPTLGGFLADQGGRLIPMITGWRLVFFINVPFGLLALYVIIRHMPSSLSAPHPKRVDWLSAILLVSGISMMVVAIQTYKISTDTRSALVLFLIASAALSFFIFRTLHHSNPLLHLSLFKNRVFGRAALAIFLLGGAFLGIIIFEPIFMIKVLHRSATGAGMCLIPLSLGIVCTSMLSGRMVSKHGHYKLWLLAGLILLAAGLLLLISATGQVSFKQLLVYMAICGLGLGPTMPLYTLAVQNAVEGELTGQATSACQFFRQIGGLMTSAILGMILACFLSGKPAISPAIAYTVAICHVYQAILFLVITAFIVTLYLPELALKAKHNRLYGFK